MCFPAFLVPLTLGHSSSLENSYSVLAELGTLVLVAVCAGIGPQHCWMSV